MINSSNSVAIFIACSISFQSVDCLLNCVSWGSFCSVPIGSQFFENAEITFSSSEYIWIICSSSLSSFSSVFVSSLFSNCSFFFTYFFSSLLFCSCFSFFNSLLFSLLFFFFTNYFFYFFFY